jgi:hypothetical protein
MESGTFTSRDLFLSYSSPDRAVVARVRSAIAQHASTFFDREDLTPGEPWFDELEAALSNCRGVAVFIGPNGIGSIQKREIQAALQRQAQEEQRGVRFRVVPVLLDGVDPESISGFLALNTWVDLRGRTHDPDAVGALLRAITRESESDGHVEASTVCPYRGLNSFQEQDAGLFFGRDQFSAKLLKRTLAEIGCDRRPFR